MLEALKDQGTALKRSTRAGRRVAWQQAMTKICNYHAVGLRRHRSAAPHCLGLLAGALLLLTPLIVVAQSAALPLPR